MPSFSNLVAATAVTFACVASAKTCPPLGPVLPAPKAPSQHASMQKAVKNLTAGLDETASAFNTTGLSIGVKSLHEKKQLFSYHFTPPVSSGIGTNKIDEETIYRVGSVSKMMTILAALQNSNINMDASVLDYIPELANVAGSKGVYATPWKDITVRSLASHLSGLATDMATDLGVFPSEIWGEMGLPDIPDDERPRCYGMPPTEACTQEDLLENIGRLSPVSLPHTAPTYSNTAYAILGMIVEAATGKSFNEAVKSSIFDVVGMKSTSFDGPVDSFSEKGFVPMGEPTWNATLGVFEAAGGMFSNTVDLIAFADAILNNKLLSASQTRQWMKPETHTSSAYYSVGESWEILRSPNITSDGRLLDVYVKTGDLGLYHAVLAIVPDYDISISVLSGGIEASAIPFAHTIALSAVLQTLLPAVEAAGRDEAMRFEGTYSDESTNSTITLATDDGPGLVIKDFQVRGFDVLHNFNAYSINTILSSSSDKETSTKQLPAVDARLYPTERKAPGAHHTTETAWRAIFDSATPEENAQLESNVFYPDASCVSWVQMDRAAYNYRSLADFAIVEAERGDVVKAVKNRAFNVTLTKVSDGDNKEGGNGSEAPMPEGAAGRAMIMGDFSVMVVTVLILVHFL